jgi:hypothetical protein
MRLPSLMKKNLIKKILARLTAVEESKTSLVMIATILIIKMLRNPLIVTLVDKKVKSLFKNPPLQQLEERVLNILFQKLAMLV